MSGQLHIDFTPTRHRENNAESQAYLDANLDKMAEQCRRVYFYMKRHPFINLKLAINDIDVWELRRRIKDLKDKHGIVVYDQRQVGGYKNYSLKPFKTKLNDSGKKD